MQLRLKRNGMELCGGICPSELPILLSVKCGDELELGEARVGHGHVHVAVFIWDRLLWRPCRPCRLYYLEYSGAGGTRTAY